MQPTPPDPNLAAAAAQPAGVHAMPTLVTAIGAAAAALVVGLVSFHEGTVLRGYRDIGGVVTACTGHTRTAVLGRRYTAEECTALLASDLVMHAADLACITHPLQPHEKAALLSFVYSTGPGKAGVKDGLCVLKRGGPSTIVRRANAGDMAGACAAISEWTGVKGRDCAAPQFARWCGGIVTRRAAERAMCEGRYLGAPAAAAGTPA